MNMQKIHFGIIGGQLSYGVTDDDVPIGIFAAVFSQSQIIIVTIIIGDVRNQLAEIVVLSL
ncbi:hypothetical protein COX76_00610 [Candidatus Kaiserbacteria bacterium CG_4_10_14_0_2_um_filter_50_16]|nr:MAG: hypothetical protein COX76_00610 [Candidatus Kaiserbacteria bacterium CG_4_10_14_0_2_um_filter_50_16]